MWLAQGWRDYRLIDAGDGDRLEQWGDVILRRPDPQVIWPLDGDPAWQRADARYLRSRTGGGHWEYRRPIPEEWTVGWQELTFRIRPMGFKHTGLFPEQAANWQWMTQLVRRAGRPGGGAKSVRLHRRRVRGVGRGRSQGRACGRGPGHGGPGQGEPPAFRPGGSAGALHRGRCGKIRRAGKAAGPALSRAS